MASICPERDAKFHCRTEPKMPERVRLDPDYKAWGVTQVVGFSSDGAPKDWPEYVRTDVALAMDAKLIQAEIVRLLLTAGFEDVAEFIDSDWVRASIKDTISIRTSP